MATERFANLAQTAVATGGYTAGSGVLNVTSTAAPFPTSPVFSLSLINHTTGAVIVLLRVSAVNSGTQWAVAAEGTDTSAGINDIVVCVETAASFAQFLIDARVSLPGTFGITIDGAGTAPATGSKGYVQIPYAGTITGYTMVGNVSGSAQITLKKCADGSFPTTASIVASAPCVLAAAQKNTDNTLTGWTVSVTALDWVEFNLDSVTTLTRIQLFVRVARS